MNLRLIMDDDYRENVLKAIYSHGENGELVTASSFPRGFSPLPTMEQKALLPHVFYSHLSSECYAQELIDELNNGGQK